MRFSQVFMMVAAITLVGSAGHPLPAEAGELPSRATRPRPGTPTARTRQRGSLALSRALAGLQKLPLFTGQARPSLRRRTTWRAAAGLAAAMLAITGCSATTGGGARQGSTGTPASAAEGIRLEPRQQVKVTGDGRVEIRQLTAEEAKKETDWRTRFPAPAPLH
jgi:hypothetical protein